MNPFLAAPSPTQNSIALLGDAFLYIFKILIGRTDRQKLWPKDLHVTKTVQSGLPPATLLARLGVFAIGGFREFPIPGWRKPPAPSYSTVVPDHDKRPIIGVLIKGHLSHLGESHLRAQKYCTS